MAKSSTLFDKPDQPDSGSRETTTGESTFPRRGKKKDDAKTEEEILGEWESLTETSNIETQDLVMPKKETITPETMQSIVSLLADSFGITQPLALLKGAANKSTPNSLSVTVIFEGEEVTISKADLMYFYRTSTGNQYLRRFAETMQNQISEFAFKNGLDGDLAKQLARKVQLDPEQTPLTKKERAYASSFNQDSESLGSTPEFSRLVTLLTQYGSAISHLMYKFKKGFKPGKTVNQAKIRVAAKKIKKKIKGLNKPNKLL